MMHYKVTKKESCKIINELLEMDSELMEYEWAAICFIKDFVHDSLQWKIRRMREKSRRETIRKKKLKEKVD